MQARGSEASYVQRQWDYKNSFTYCWWKKSCTTWYVENPGNNGIFTISTGAGILPSTVVYRVSLSSLFSETLEVTCLRVRDPGDSVAGKNPDSNTECFRFGWDSLHCSTFPTFASAPSKTDRYVGMQLLIFPRIWQPRVVLFVSLTV